jgi:radical SAM protein with 4Fe4S-binding SPASM domain
VGLSTNGTLIGREQADKIGQSGVDYVGISIDGKRRAHDEFRGLTGAFDMSWNAISLLNRIGVKTGVRFTLTGDNCSDLLDILEMTSRAGTKRFCLYHLVYAGRAGKEQDLALKDKKRYMESFFNKVKELALLDPAFEALTTDNPVDGLFLSRFAGDSEAALSCISSSGGCSAGERIVYLDSNGDVFPCQFLRDLPLGNVLERPLIDIWEDAGNVYLRQLRSKKDFVTGRCALCSHKEICAGCRARAKACYGSLWAEDPACYLEASEINNVALSYRS